MAWRFDPISNSLVWSMSIEMIQVTDGAIDLGVGDLLIDTGMRDDESSVLDQGQRVIDGSI